VPEHGGDFGGVSGASAFDVGHDDTHAGGYAKSAMRSAASRRQPACAPIASMPRTHRGSILG
jgi:hypothetical protein